MKAAKKVTKAQEMKRMAIANKRKLNKEFIEKTAPAILESIEALAAAGKTEFRKTFPCRSDKTEELLVALMKYLNKQGFVAGLRDPNHNGSNQFPDPTTRLMLYVKW
jgi:hypothetical protein